MSFLTAVRTDFKLTAKNIDNIISIFSGQAKIN
jgi:hypothetical protein